MWSSGSALAAAERPRPLTGLQAAVIDSMLAGEPGSERERIRLTGIAPRSYQAARQRALETGWVVERLIPDPTLFGRARVSFALARPNPADLAESIDRWTHIERAVLLWKSSNALFGVFTGEDRDRATPIARELASKSRYARSFLLELNLKSPTVPIYFDFEAEWSRVVGIPGVSCYPRQFPRHPRGTTRARGAITARWREIVRRLAHPSPLSEAPDGFLSGLGRRASAARALRTGWMDRRAFLSPSDIPPYEEWALGQVVFVHGRLREGRRPETLLRTLIVSCAVQPFLFATAGGDVLLATLSPLPPQERGMRQGVSVSGTMNRFLERVDVDRFPATELETVVNHHTELFAEA